MSTDLSKLTIRQLLALYDAHAAAHDDICRKSEIGTVPENRGGLRAQTPGRAHLSIGVQSGPPIGAQKGPPWRCVDRLMLGTGFALLAA